MASKNFTLLLYLGFFMHFIHAVPERGIKEMLFDEKDQYKSFAKSLFKDAEITISGEVTWGKDDDGKPIKADTLVLNWYLLYSNCAQYFVQVKEDILPLMVVDKQNMQVQHTIYNQGYLEFKDGHLSKTPIPLEKDKTTPDQLSTSQEQQQPPSKPDDENAGRKRRWIIREKREAPKKGVQPQLNFHPTIQAVLSSKAAKTTKPTTPKAESSKKPALLNKKHTSVKPKISTAAVKGTSKVAGMDGNYLLVISLQQKLPKDASVHVTVRIKMNTGFLSAAEWPLLPFYGAMSLVYLAYGVVWLIVSACQWRELLRIQFWIGGVIALGMLEKAVLFSEYNNVNDTGVPAHGLVVLALVLSCIKRTLSRILIIIVSMGFGIVKPRLGAALHRVLGVGCLYFILCVIEGSYREFSVKADVNRKQVIATVPLSVLDAVICWWIFMSLLQTMRTLRIRKNLVKLSLYRHFTNILIVSVIASVAFMIWVIKAHSFNSCITDWKEIWIDDAFWHFLFALILLAIMVLWRPTANNQRYAFAPLIDVGEDDDDDMTLSDAFQGMKMRGKGEGEVPNRAEKQRKKAEDDLKWVEENIPTSGGIDTALPSLLDSDEEMMTTKLEMSKME